jgi:hypothetical protein
MDFVVGGKKSEAIIVCELAYEVIHDRRIVGIVNENELDIPP